MGFYVPTFCDYIDSYIRAKKTRIPFGSPGEHHFVSVYLLDRLHGHKGIPTYVNPDGKKGCAQKKGTGKKKSSPRKNVPGDIVYVDEHGRVHSGIEVKFDYVQFTRRECEEWLLNRNRSVSRPSLFIGIGKAGLLLARWQAFVLSFRQVVAEARKKGVSKKKSLMASKKSGAVRLRQLMQKGGKYTSRVGLLKIAQAVRASGKKASDVYWWPHSTNTEEARRYERQFRKALKQRL